MAAGLDLKPGSLVQIVDPVDGRWTLCIRFKGSQGQLTEVSKKRLAIFSAPQYKKTFLHIEGKWGLVVYILMNKLEQPIGYRVLIEGHEVFCKAIIADKYFKFPRAKKDEGRRLSTF